MTTTSADKQSKLSVTIIGIVVIAWSLIANIVSSVNTQRIDDVAARVAVNTPIIMQTSGTIKRIEGLEESHFQIHRATDRELASLRAEIRILRVEIAEAQAQLRKAERR